MLQHQTKWRPLAEFLVWREDPGLTTTDPFLPTWQTVKFWRGFGFREVVFSGWWKKLGKNWRGIPLSPETQVNVVVIVVVFHMFEKRVFAIACKRYINLKLLLFSCYSKLSTNDGRKNKSSQ